MRSRTLAFPLLALAVFGLLLAPAVMAGGDAAHAKSAEARAKGEAMRANHTHDDNDTDDNGTERGPKEPKRGPMNPHVPAHVTAFWTRMAELRAAWHENATQVRADCQAAESDNASAAGHCIRDGYKELRAWLRAELEAAREDFRAGHAIWKAERKAARDA